MKTKCTKFIFVISAMLCERLNISNGRLDSLSRHYGAEVTISCNTGHEIDGESVVQTQCQVNNSVTFWTKNPGKCDSKST